MNTQCTQFLTQFLSKIILTSAPAQVFPIVTQRVFTLIRPRSGTSDSESGKQYSSKSCAISVKF
jgi:hypothetical protein